MAALSRLQLAKSLLKRSRFVPFAPRCYFASAAAQLDYYSEEEEEEEEEEDRNRTEVIDSAGWVPRRGIQWCLIGDRSARKHLYAEKLSKLLEVPRISMGSLVRQDFNPRSVLYKQIARAVNGGKLVEDEVISALLSKRLEEGYYRGENGFVLDGIPRTRMQAELIDQIAEIDLVVNLKSGDDHLVNKNLGTGAGLALSQEYLMSSNVMHDVNLQEAQLRSAKAELSKLLEDYYRKQNKLIDFHINDATGETWKGLLATLHLQHINAVSSSKKLTA